MRSVVRWISLLIFFSGCCAAGALYFLFTTPWIDVSRLERYDPGKPTILLDEHGKEWARFELDRRDPIPYHRMPHHLIEAFLSAEDWHFFEHCGISWKGIARSIAINLYHGKRVQGASTITQQLVKLLFFDLKKTFTRKLKEQLYALIIERQFSKQHILEVYLNHVYFGCGIYGVQAAAQAFWGKSVEQLTIDQAATLAGIIRGPAYYCPLLHPDASEQRRDVVIQLMRNRGVITHQEYEDAIATPLAVCEQAHATNGHHAKEYIRIYLEKVIGKTALYRGGFLVQTTINQEKQRIAQREFHTQVMHLKKEFGKPIDGGFISFDVQSGAIRAMVGGRESTSLFNRATQARRQMGSIFKPIVYAAALEQGMKFSDIVIDEPFEIVQDGTVWTPHNYDKKYNGAITRAYALSHSNNIVTIKTVLSTGIDHVIALAQRCHLPGPLHPYLSLALGCTDATLLQAGAAFNIFANNGLYVQPHTITWIKDATGKRIYTHRAISERVLDVSIAHQVAQVLQLGIERTKVWFADRWFEGQAISKTGTTNESRTCWYIGSTPTLTTAVFIGCDDNQSMGKNIYPVQTAFPIWLGYTRAFASPTQQFTFDPSLQRCTIDERSGRKVRPGRAGAIEILV